MPDFFLCGRGMPPFDGWSGSTVLPAVCHNLGFCYSDRTMRWKHLTAMAFAEEIGDWLGLERVYVNFTDALMGLGRPREAAELAHAGLEVTRRYGIQSALLITNHTEALLAIGEWDEERHAAMTAECDAAVRAAQKESEKVGILPDQGKDNVGSMFDDVYAEVPWHLAEQREEALRETAREGRD